MEETEEEVEDNDDDDDMLSPARIRKACASLVTVNSVQPIVAAPAPPTDILCPLQYGYDLRIVGGVVPELPLEPPEVPLGHNSTFYTVSVGRRVGVYTTWYVLLLENVHTVLLMDM